MAKKILRLFTYYAASVNIFFFCTENLTGDAVLWCFFQEINHLIFHVKISV